VYERTEFRELEPVAIALGRGRRRLPMTPGAAHGVDSLVLALKWRFDPDAARDLTGGYELRLSEDCFGIDIADGRLKTQRGLAEVPDAIIETDPREA
jgi:hypothetical protein